MRRSTVASAVDATRFDEPFASPTFPDAGTAFLLLMQRMELFVSLLETVRDEAFIRVPDPNK